MRHRGIVARLGSLGQSIKPKENQRYRGYIISVGIGINRDWATKTLRSSAPPFADSALKNLIFPSQRIQHYRSCVTPGKEKRYSPSRLDEVHSSLSPNLSPTRREA
ncbi:MAG TPA: hypothetical protein V6D26_04860, partial [Stenomitos sp.]